MVPQTVCLPVDKLFSPAFQNLERKDRSAMPTFFNVLLLALQWMAASTNRQTQAMIIQTLRRNMTFKNRTQAVRRKTSNFSSLMGQEQDLLGECPRVTML